MPFVSPPTHCRTINSVLMYHGLSAWSSAEPEGSKSHGAPLCYVELVDTTLQYCCNLTQCCIKQLQSRANALDCVTIGWTTHHLGGAQQAQVRLLNPS